MANNAEKSVNDLSRMIESLGVTRNYCDLRAAVNAGNAWDNRQIMMALDDRSTSINKVLTQTASSMRAISGATQINEAKIVGLEEEVSEMKNDILGKVGKAMDDMQDNVVTHQDLRMEISKSNLSKEVKQLEKAVTVDERGFCMLTLILHGLMQVVVGREKPNETLELVWNKFLCHLGLNRDNLTVISAHRMPRGRNSTKPAPIKIRFFSPADVHMVMENLHHLKGIRECKGMHIERDVPMMLNDERKKGNAILYQYRKTHGKEYQGKMWYPGNRVQVAVRKKGESDYKDLTKDEMEQLYRATQTSTSWADDAGDDDTSTSGSATGGSKRPRSTPGESSRSKASRWSEHLFN